MTADGSRQIAQRFLDGLSTALGGSLGQEVTIEMLEIEAAAPDHLATCLEDGPVVLLQATGMPAVQAALLVNAQGALALLAARGEKEAPPDQSTLSEEQGNAWQELAGPWLASAIESLFRAPAAPAPAKGVLSLLEGSTALDDLREVFSPEGSATRVEISVASGVSASAILLHSAGLQQAADASASSEEPADKQADKDRERGATLSPEEMSDILSGFDEAEENEPVKAGSPDNLDMVLDLRLVATARLGGIEMPIGEILHLGPGSIIDVGHLIDEPVELMVNDKLIARGEVVVVDEKFGLRITEIVSPRVRIESLR